MFKHQTIVCYINDLEELKRIKNNHACRHYDKAKAHYGIEVARAGHKWANVQWKEASRLALATPLGDVD